MTATTNGRRTQQAQLCRWFIKEGLIASSESRTWQEDVDWVFHESGRVLSPAEVENSVATLRAQACRSRSGPADAARSPLQVRSIASGP